MTNRLTFHDDEQRPKMPQLPPLSDFKGDDSCNPTDYSSSCGAAVALDKRISQQQLAMLEHKLGERDMKILSALRHCRYLMTLQVKRLYFLDAKTPEAGLRAANRNLDKLKNYGLIAAFIRRIGGMRGGSGSLIWYLTSAGERLLRLGDEGPHSRKRFFEPSPYFLAHTLSVAECYVQLTEICAGRGLKLITTEMETDCWRSYSHQGVLTTLRPDLFAITECGDYEDRWFFEVDLKTEASTTVVEKCRRYHQYYRSGLEQKLHGVFPLAVWIVPDAARKESIVAHIRAEFDKQPKIFVVITPDELKPLIRQGAEGGSLC